jgi:hypothetical protein
MRSYVVYTCSCLNSINTGLTSAAKNIAMVCQGIKLHEGSNFLKDMFRDRPLILMNGGLLLICLLNSENVGCVTLAGINAGFCYVSHCSHTSSFICVRGS